ncbi:E3 ubiquitin- ligase NRDP1 [Paramuricea clavata]|uniref:E3 ubiquitin- ligase NRDP1, partial n=1 Tax=Paramuricea clavata TaxID=317549 RepID=A0A6S7K1G7_PARCT|nr:E3 ubiquitin- ligase NRDP1 [Paramuricea clavata]
MATGYEDSRFETQVDQSLHCAICTEVLKDPVQCRRNEHHFCRNCITEHLRHSQNCPTCKDPLTVETLVRPQRFLANTLSSLKISCENSERGCRKVIELGSLDTHVATCGFSPVPCSNDQCEEIISRRDKEIHENKVCGFRRVKCDYCAQMVLYKNFMQHTCPAQKEIRKIKAELREVRSTLDEMFKMMQNMMSSLTRLERNTAQRSEGSHASSGQELQAEIVVAGGFDKSVEVFNMTTKTWRSLSEMNECRDGASLVLYQGHMIVTGGVQEESGICQLQDSAEELNLAEQDGHWVVSQFKLPVPSCGHACVVYQNRVFLIGGYAFPETYDTIHEIQLTPPYTSRLLTKMPMPICYHGAEIVNGKIYIIGGSTTGDYEDATSTVLMFDPATNTCTELKPLPYTASTMTTVTWKDNVVVLGGVDNQHNTLSTVILYNVTTGSHRMLPEMTKKRYGCTAVTIGDNIIAMGGCDESDTDLNSVECYNFHTNTWTEFPAMAKTRSGAAAVVKYC